MNNDVLLFGGGLDSACYLLHFMEMGLEPTVLHVDYGQKACRGERNAASLWANRCKFPFRVVTTGLVLKFGSDNALMGLSKSLYVNGRNLALVLAALEFGNTIHLGITQPTHAGIADYHDASQTFLDSMNAVLRLSFQKPFRVEARLMEVPKEELVEKYMTKYPNLFEETWTCFESASLTECGFCRHCQSKKELKEKLWSKQSSTA